MFIGSCVILQPLRQGLRGSPFTDEDTDFREVKVLAGGHTAWDVKLGLSVCLSICLQNPLDRLHPATAGPSWRHQNALTCQGVPSPASGKQPVKTRPV